MNSDWRYAFSSQKNIRIRVNNFSRNFSSSSSSINLYFNIFLVHETNLRLVINFFKVISSHEILFKLRLHSGGSITIPFLQVFINKNKNKKNLHLQLTYIQSAEIYILLCIIFRKARIVNYKSKVSPGARSI